MVTPHRLSPRSIVPRAARRQRSVFEWDGNHPALNFVNTLDERLSDAPVERLPTYTALVSFTVQAGLIDRATARKFNSYQGEPAAQNVLANAVVFRESLHEVLGSWLSGKAPVPTALAKVNAQLAAAFSHRKLTVARKAITRTWDAPLAVQRPIWELSVAVDNLFSQAQFQRARKCAACDCGVLFLDLSKAGRRKWCSMANCGNRAKVRRFRGRRLTKTKDLLRASRKQTLLPA